MSEVIPEEAIDELAGEISHEANTGESQVKVHPVGDSIEDEDAIDEISDNETEEDSEE